MSFYAYLLRCSDSSYYAGHSDDLDARLVAHQTGIIRGYTYSRRPVELVWHQEFPSRDEAFLSERQIKGWSRAKKEALIRGNWDAIVTLAAKRSATRRVEAASSKSRAAHPSSASG